MPTFEATDMEVAHHLLSSMYGSRRLSVSGDVRLVRLEQHVLGAFELHRTKFMMVFEVVGSPLEALAFGHVRSGTVTFARSTGPDPLGAGDAFLAGQPDAHYQAKLADSDIELAFLPPSLLSEVVDAVPGQSHHPVHFTGYQPPSPRAAAVWIRAFRYVRDNFVDTPAADEPLLVANAGRLLAAAALSTFPNTALWDPTIEDRNDAHPRTLRRAVTFIEENAHRDISAADIAGAVHVTIRALQLAFRRHLDTTPMAYLRAVRLERAHRALRGSDPATATVGGIAARWGFESHSRFTSRYRAAYGVTPSETLRADP